MNANCTSGTRSHFGLITFATTLRVETCRGKRPAGDELGFVGVEADDPDVGAAVRETRLQ
jgi:hypothetical protein